MMFLEKCGVCYRVLIRQYDGIWIIDCDNPKAPIFVSNEEKYNRVKTPQNIVIGMDTKRVKTKSEIKKLAMIQPIIANDEFIIDTQKRKQKAKEIAEKYKTTSNRVLNLYYKYLAHGNLMVISSRKNTSLAINEKYFMAIEKYYYSSSKCSLKDAYYSMLLENYTNGEGRLVDNYPSWYSFRHYFYRNMLHKSPRKIISRNGLSDYQRNHRVLQGSAIAWRDKIGHYQMDATQADIYIVSRFDSSAVIGRPYIYLAVDTVTELIAGIYIGMESGENAVIKCLVNAAMNKVDYCSKHGIEISYEQWPSSGIASEIITDKGRDFCSNKVYEFCMNYGLEHESLPPYRPDCKGIVEKTFGLINQRYKPVLRGKGVIEDDAMERWATDYREQAVLNLEDFTKIVINIVIYLNTRVLKNYPLTKEMILDKLVPTPSNLWIWHEKMGRSNLIDIDEEELHILSMNRKSAKVTKKGVEHNGLFYNSKEFKHILECMDGYKVDIFFDVNNTSTIYLLHESEYIVLGLIKSQLRYDGITYEELEQLRNKDKQLKSQSERQNIEARLKMSCEIKNIVDKAVFVDKTPKLNRKIINNNRLEERDKLT